MMIQDITECHVNDALHHISQAEYGAHYMIMYSDLVTIRKLYSDYIPTQIEHNNETVLINPFYETIDSDRQVLPEKYNDDGMNSVSKYEKEESLIIIDALEEYFGDKILVDHITATELKNGLTSMYILLLFPLIL